MIYHFDTADAKAYGTDEAILLYNVVGWLRLNKAERRNHFDGHTWTYNTARALVEVFDDIWNEDQIRRLINKLVKIGVLIKGNYNAEVGRRRDDRTLWLALADEARLTAKKGGEDRPEPPANSPDASGESAAGVRRKCGTPPANSPDASGESAESYKEQKETSSGKTPLEKQQQQPLLPPQLPFDDDESTHDAAAADSLRSVEELPKELTEELTPDECDARQAMAHTLHTLGVKGVEAQALVADFSLEAIQQQIDWLPYQNCDQPGYWLPRYIREIWPKPKAVERQEAEAAAEAARAARGLTRQQQQRQEAQVRECQARRRREYREELDADDKEALRLEAETSLFEESIWRDVVREKGKDAPSFRYRMESEMDRIVDSRLDGRP